MALRKRKRKQIKYRQICFKLTTGQKAALDRYCRAYNTTPLRFIRSVVMEHVERYRPDNPPPSYVTRNQLELFDSDL